MAIPRRGKSDSPVEIHSVKQRLKALELREQGLSYDQIAETMGLAKPVVWRLVKKAVAANLKKYKEAAEHLVEIQKTRLEKVIQGLAKKVAAGDARACEVYIKANESLRKLLGLDAPERKDVRVGLVALDDLTDAELAEQARRIGLATTTELNQLPYALPGELLEGETPLPETKDQS